MGERWRKLVLVVTVAFAVLVGGFFLTRKSGPVFEGEGIYFWAMRMHNPRLPADQQAAAQEAIRELAPRCIPTLLAWLRESEPPYSEPAYVRALNKILSWQHSITVTATVTYQPSRPVLAYQVFQDMGPAANSAIPGLIQMLQDKNLELAGKACMLLAKIGPATIPEVTPLLSSTNDMTRALGAATLGVMGPQAKPLIPNLEQLLSDKSNIVRLAAASALVKIGGDPQPLVPVLLESWHTVDFEGRSSALDALAELKGTAKSAVPDLTNSLAKTTDPADRLSLLSALRAIDPETAAKLAPTAPQEAEPSTPPDSALDTLIDPKR